MHVERVNYLQLLLHVHIFSYYTICRNIERKRWTAWAAASKKYSKLYSKAVKTGTIFPCDDELGEKDDILWPISANHLYFIPSKLR